MSTKLNHLIKSVKVSQKNLVEAKKRYEDEITEGLNELVKIFNIVLEDKWQSIIGETSACYQYCDEFSFRYGCHTEEWDLKEFTLAIEAQELCEFVFIKD